MQGLETGASGSFEINRCSDRKLLQHKLSGSELSQAVPQVPQLMIQAKTVGENTGNLPLEKLKFRFHISRGTTENTLSASQALDMT